MSIYGKRTLKPSRIDFRSDTLTKPTREMLESTFEAIVGDDVFEEDSTVMELQSKVAKLAGKEAGLFVCSGVMSNQLGINCHLSCPPVGVLCDKRAHVYQYEGGAIAMHNGAHVVPISTDTFITLSDIKKEVCLDDDIHHARTALICLENSVYGTIYPLEEQQKISEFAKQNSIKMHLDGARLWNVSTETNIPLNELCKPFDTISLCLSKGLGAPIGSVLVGSKEAIMRARRIRKMFGGGWRQAGVIAAMGIYAIDNNFKLLKQTHENAKMFSIYMQKLGFLLTKPCDTNMVWLSCEPLQFSSQYLADKLQEHGILIFGGKGHEIRFVFHFQQEMDLIMETLAVIEKVIKEK